MNALLRFATRSPLLITLLFIGLIYSIVYWLSPGIRFPLITIFPFIIILYKYYQYRKGNRQPLEKMAYLSIIMAITLAVLLIVTRLFDLS
ncbi:hypothetical protein SAMN05444008_103131 [Cnuella takakiae]|uniref:Uncharacterized protein n=1 Tax=Cnuella takakiae TaxID=1302690 RepID=A0A1M4WSY3_9BACT|nr:hypothetical protein SAMN05444008_103131 [Cnuella takakiae]